MSVNSYLKDLSSSLVLSGDELTSIQTSIKTLAARLQNYFGSNIVENFKFGSSTRGTMLPRKADSNSDIDYMIVFNISDGKKKPQTYLDRLKRFAESKYSTSEIKQSSPTIVLSLNHIKFELVPAYKDYSGYSIPSPKSSWSEWMFTDPNGFNEKIVTANVNNNSAIKPLVRLIKYWNAQNGYHFASYDLENFICEMYFWNCVNLNDYFYAFWEKISATSNSQTVNAKVDKAKRHAVKAKEYEQGGYSTLAESEIKKIVPKL